MSWRSIFDESFDAGLDILRPLAAQKLIDDGVIRRPPTSAPVVAPYVSREMSPANVIAQRDPSTGVVPIVLIVIVVALLLRN